MSEVTFLSFFFLLPEVFFLFGFLLIFVLVFYLPLRFQMGILKPVRNAWLSKPTAFLSLLILFVYAVLKLSTPVPSHVEYLFFDTVRLSEGVIFYQSLIIFFAFFAGFILSVTRLPSFEFWIVFLLFSFSCVLLPSFVELIGIYLLFELQGFCSYIMASMERQRNLAVEAGLKYFVLGAFISGFLLFGISLLYLAFGSTKLSDIMLLAFGLEPNYFIFLGFLLILSSLFFKLASFPFHTWVSDVYSGVSLPVLIAFTVLPKFSIWGVIMVQFYPVFLTTSFFDLFGSVLPVVGLVGVLVGSFGAVYQDDFKKFIAYSSVANMGYVTLAFSANIAFSLFSVIFYLILYGFLLLGFLSLPLSISEKTEQWEDRTMSVLGTLQFLFRSHKLYGYLGSLLLFSMAGVPPLMGFFPKFNVILTVWSSGNSFIAVSTALVSVMSAVYYLVLFSKLYFSSVGQKDDKIRTYILKDTPALFIFVGVSLFNVFYVLIHSFVGVVVWYIVFKLF